MAKSLWHLINTEHGKTNKRSDLYNIKLNNNGNITENPSEISHIFNCTFINSARQLVSNTGTVKDDEQACTQWRLLN